MTSTKLIFTKEGIRRFLCKEELERKLDQDLTDSWGGIECRNERQQILKDELDDLNESRCDLIKLCFSDIRFLRSYCMHTLHFPMEQAIKIASDTYGPYVNKDVLNDLISKIRLTHEWAEKRRENGRMDLFA